VQAHDSVSDYVCDYVRVQVHVHVHVDGPTASGAASANDR